MTLHYSKTLFPSVCSCDRNSVWLLHKAVEGIWTSGLWSFALLYRIDSTDHMWHNQRFDLTRLEVSNETLKSWGAQGYSKQIWLCFDPRKEKDKIIAPFHKATKKIHKLWQHLYHLIEKTSFLLGFNLFKKAFKANL